MAVWDTKYINDLPDDCFAYISPGGKKDDEGKTVPRSLRHLPYKDAKGNIDSAHVRNALARLPQTDIPEEAKKIALSRLKAAAKECGIETKLADDTAGKLLIPILRLGQWKHPVYGDIVVTQKTLSDIIKNFKANVLGRPPFIRIGHDRANKQTFGDAEAVGWIKDIVQYGDVLYALAEPTTPEIAQMIKNKQYRFSSAEYADQYTDKETGMQVPGAVLFAVALTNEPFLTRLPDAMVLAEYDQFILDYGTKEGDKMNFEEMFKRLSDLFTGFFARQDQTNKDTQTVLAEVQAKLAAQEEQNRKLAEEKAAAERAQKLAEVKKEAAELVAQGIPPVMVEKWKALAASDAGNAVIKLADGKESTQADEMKAMLLAMPKENRIDMSQRGTQTLLQDKEKIKLAADELVKSIGGKITTDGRYII